MTTWQAEFDRLSLHRRILTNKLTIPSNPATVESLQRQLNKVNFFFRRHVEETIDKTDPVAEAMRVADVVIGIKKRRSKDRARLRRARRDGDDDYAERVEARIERQTSRLEDIRDEQELDPVALRRFRKVPTAEDAKEGIEVVIRIQRASLAAAKAHGDVEREQDITARIGRLEAMIAALPGVPRLAT